jgi:hypothetical protein
MPRCTECEWDYPEHLLNIITGGIQLDGLYCPICALALTNRIHGINRTKFSGPRAEALRQEAIKWREDCPEANPNHEISNRTND